MTVLIGVSGSFKPLPVRTQVTVAVSGIAPSFKYLINPARPAALDGSQKIPSVLALEAPAVHVS